MLLAVAFIYIVLASQFESFLEPVLIMLSLPLAIVGALLLLLVTRHHLGMPAMIGVVMLMGLVTKNAILLVDYTNQLHREEGLSVREALLKAGPVRLRPIVMTTLAMILGMLPSALGRGEGGEFRAPISVATIGGLITSTLLTLVVVPVAYLLLARILGRIRAWRGSPAAAAVAGRPRDRCAHPRAPARRAARGGERVRADAPARWPARAAGAGRDPGAHVRPGAGARAGAQRVAEGRRTSSVRESEGRVAEARAAFLPTLDLSFLYTPAQQFPLIRFPAGSSAPRSSGSRPRSRARTSCS